MFCAGPDSVSLADKGKVLHSAPRSNLTESPECRMLDGTCYMTRNEPSSLPAPQMEEDPRFLTEQIVTYLGNKRSLLHFLGTGLEQVKKRLGKERLKAGDLFSGSGIVARFLKQHSEDLIVNDLEEYSRVVNTCYLSNAEEVENLELDRHYRRLLRYMETHESPGFITELYAPRNPDCITADDRVFYTRRNAVYLDTARQTINLLPAEVRPYFIAPLLAEASVHTNTSGVFKGFYKDRNGIGKFGGTGGNALSRILGEISLPFPVFSRFDCRYSIHCRDANELAAELPEMDVVYLDPPYNQHPYGSNYFMLSLLSSYEKPEETSRVSGIPADWKRSTYNSRQHAPEALFRLLEDCPAKFILLSYSSEGFINYEEMTGFLGRLGHTVTLETPYAAFRGSRNFRNRPQNVTEFLFLVERF